MTAADNAVVARDLAVDHEGPSGTVRALDHPQLDVEGGTSLAIMGPSGCGKSTLLGLLAGLATPTRGRVSVGGTTISALPESERVGFRRRALGMIFQADNLLPHLTVEENVGLRRALSGNASSGPFADIGRLLDRLGIGRLGTRLPDQLSGGQRQRVAVARAIVHGPELILADEPTGALDEGNARAVIQLMAEVHREIGATLIFVTHDPAIAEHADRIEHLQRAGAA